MALEDDLQQPGGPQGAALEERVARLERELDALRRQLASASAVPSALVTPAEPRPAPPPQSVLRRSDTAAKDVPPLTPEPPVAAPPPRPDEVRAYPLPIPPPQPAKPRGSFEDRLGSQIFNRIGIVLLLIGTAWFLKLAVDRRWIVPSPTGRVIVGLLAGAGIVLWSERFRRKGFAAFSYSLKALGSGVLYLSLWAAFQIYHLLPAPAALGLMVLVTTWNAWMAWAQNSELLAAYALAGGFATPMLLSSGGNHETFLFSYLLAIDIATVVLVRVRGWPRLLLGAFPLTMAFFIGWYVEFFAASELALTSVFIVLFGCTFSSVPVRYAVDAAKSMTRTNRSMLIEDILLPLANAAFLSLSFYSVLQDSGHHALLPWLMVVLATVYLGFMRLPQSRTASAIHLSLAIVFLTIAVPLKASGHWITVSWLVEGLALLWVATRLAPAPEQEPSDAYASRTLRWLASAALLLGFCGIFFDFNWAGAYDHLPFFNASMATAVIGIAVFAMTAWLALRSVNDAGTGLVNWPSIGQVSFVAIGLTALLLATPELLFRWESFNLHAPFQNSAFATALVGLTFFAGAIAVSLRLARVQPTAPFWPAYTAVSAVVFNLVALLTGIREIEAIWSGSAANTDAELKQALAISGFLMLYGAALLAAGFWRRSAFLRWQGLLLLVFTIFKTFLYDMRNLSQGYRVVSFLGLGALLMAISFAYQKDWLNLRGSDGVESPAESPEAAQ